VKARNAVRVLTLGLVLAATVAGLAATAQPRRRVLDRPVEAASAAALEMPRGIYLYTEEPVQGDQQFADALKVRGLDGMAVVLDWSLIEPSEGKFDFSSADFQVAEAQQHNLAIELVVRAGSRTPAWLSPTQQLKLVYSPHEGAGKCSDVDIPPPWSSDYQSAFKVMLNRTAKHFQKTGAHIAVVKLTGLNTTTEELRLPAEVADKTANKSGCTNAGADDVTIWKGAGYSDALVTQAFNQLNADFANDFPDTPITLAIIPHGGFPPIGGDGAHEPMVALLVSDAAASFAGRFTLQYDYLGYDQAVKSEVMDLAGNTLPVAWQTNLWMGGQKTPQGETEGAACGGKPGDKSDPVTGCSDAQYLNLLGQGITPAGGVGPNRAGSYIEVFPFDVVQHPMQIAQAHAELMAGTYHLPPRPTPTPHCEPGVRCPLPN